MSNAIVPLEETIEVRDTCLCLHVHRAARALARRFDDALRPHGLTHGQFSMLNALNRPEPATMTQVCTVLGMDRTTLTAALKPLEHARLVRVATDRDDKRARRLVLTPKGAETLARAIPTWRQTHDSLHAPHPARLRQSLSSLTS